MSARRTPLMNISSNDVASSPPATGTRRKSGRAVRAPEKFDPGVPSSQSGPTRAKRKRVGEDLENDASDSEEVEDDSDESVESAAEEEIKEAKRKAKNTSKKPAPKKPKVNGVQSKDTAPAVRLPNRSKKLKKVAIADGSAVGLYGKRVCVKILEVRR
jgi:cohesin complex subunit SA-1/2